MPLRRTTATGSVRQIELDALGCRKNGQVFEPQLALQAAGRPSRDPTHKRALGSNAQSPRLSANISPSISSAAEELVHAETRRRGGVALRENEAPPNVFGRKTKQSPARATPSYKNFLRASASPRAPVLLAVTAGDDERLFTRRCKGAKMWCLDQRPPTFADRRKTNVGLSIMEV